MNLFAVIFLGIIAGVLVSFSLFSFFWYFKVKRALAKIKKQGQILNKGFKLDFMNKGTKHYTLEGEGVDLPKKEEDLK